MNKEYRFRFGHLSDYSDYHGRGVAIPQGHFKRLGMMNILRLVDEMYRIEPAEQLHNEPAEQLREMGLRRLRRRVIRHRVQSKRLARQVLSSLERERALLLEKARGTTRDLADCLDDIAKIEKALAILSAPAGSKAVAA